MAFAVDVTIAPPSAGLLRETVQAVLLVYVGDSPWDAKASDNIREGERGCGDIVFYS